MVNLQKCEVETQHLGGNQSGIAKLSINERHRDNSEGDHVSWHLEGSMANYCHPWNHIQPSNSFFFILVLKFWMIFRSSVRWYFIVCFGIVL